MYVLSYSSTQTANHWLVILFKGSVDRGICERERLSFFSCLKLNVLFGLLLNSKLTLETLSKRGVVGWRINLSPSVTQWLAPLKGDGPQSQWMCRVNMQFNCECSLLYEMLTECCIKRGTMLILLRSLHRENSSIALHEGEMGTYTFSPPTTALLYNSSPFNPICSGSY